jgi:hypothetical protein
MRRRIRDLFVTKFDKKTDQAAVAENADDADSALGLDIWVEGVIPIVEYVSLSFNLIYLHAQLSHLFVNGS